jgi:hypothetical protein
MNSCEPIETHRQANFRRIAIVVAIVAPLLTFAFLRWKPWWNPLLRRRTAANAAEIAEVANVFINRFGHCPGMDELVTAGLLRRVINDRWGGAFHLSCRLTATAETVFVGSAGPDGRLGTGDEILVSAGRLTAR